MKFFRSISASDDLDRRRRCLRTLRREVTAGGMLAPAINPTSEVARRLTDKTHELDRIRGSLPRNHPFSHRRGYVCPLEKALRRRSRSVPGLANFAPIRHLAISLNDGWQRFT